MCNANNHSPDCTCGWGGDGHLGVGGGGGGWSQSENPLPISTWFLGGTYISQMARLHGHAITLPTACRYCGQQVYAYSNEFGSFVLFDELGWPWPKHHCLHAPTHIQRQAREDDYSGFHTWLIESAVERMVPHLRQQAIGKGFQAVVANLLSSQKIRVKQPLSWLDFGH